MMPRLNWMFHRAYQAWKKNYEKKLVWCSDEAMVAPKIFNALQCHKTFK